MARTSSLGPSPTGTQSPQRENMWARLVNRVVKRVSEAADPTTTQIADNEWLLWKNTATSTTKLWYNDGGTMRSLGSSTLATAVATTSGSTADFTGIPSGVKRITVMLTGVSTDGTADLLLQIGDSGGIEATGYTGGIFTTASNAAWAGTGIELNTSNAATDVYQASIVLTLQDSSDNTWVISGNVWDGGTAITTIGVKALSATLDRVRLTCDTDAFDAGEVSILYE